MAVFVRLPTSDEMQYAGDVIHGKRRLDVVVYVIFALLGAAFGAAVGFAGTRANDQPVDLGFTLGCAAGFGVAFFVFAILIMSSIRSLQAVCRVWLPARVIVAVAAAAFALRVLDTVKFVLIVGPASIIQQVVLGGLGFIFALLFLNLGVRLVFLVYCMATGRDEDEIVTRSISAESSQECRGNEDRRSQSSATQETTCARRDPVE